MIERQYEQIREGRIVGRRKQDDIDWPAIERDFRLGQFSVRQIAANHGVNASSISRRAEKERWAQDRSSEVADPRRVRHCPGGPEGEGRKIRSVRGDRIAWGYRQRDAISSCWQFFPCYAGTA
jgi:hypothetical protein